MDTLKDYGGYLREARERRGLTLRRLAEVLHKSAGYLSKLETGQDPGAPLLLCALAEALGIEPETVLAERKRALLRRAALVIDERHARALVRWRCATSSRPPSDAARQQEPWSSK